MDRLKMIAIDDEELVDAYSALLKKMRDSIYIAEDMLDAIRDGFNSKKNIFMQLTDGRIVWINM